MKRVLGAVLVAMAALTSSAQAQTTPQYDYDGAIRERVYIPNGLDADRDGIEDRSAIEIMRPKELATNVPAIIAPSPYYTSACGQFVGECIGDLDSDGLNDRWPLWYDNYFVPRGYAVILAEMGGTANSTGCATNGGKEDVQSTKVVIDWLNGRIPGYTKATGTDSPITAGWHSKKAAMIGRSYNGTLPNAVAATGVEGLTTIVPIAAISSWYDYSRMGGIIGGTLHYPSWLANFVTDAPRQPICAPVRADMDLIDGDADGNMNAFWDERNYRPDAGKVKASVFATHCLQDDNVDPDQTTEWWYQLAKHNVPRKLWLCREGHIDPFMTNRVEWMRQLHAWFDHWLLGVQNGIMEEPRVDIENTKDNWAKYSDWPLPGSAETPIYLRGDSQTTTGTIGGQPGGKTDRLTWTDVSNMNEANAMNIASTTTQNNRRVFLSAPLKQDLRVSGSPKIDLYASLDKPQSNLTALLVDYGPSTQITRSGDGVSTPAGAPSDCWGPSSTRTGPDGTVMDFDSCYQQPTKPTVTVTETQGWRISRGILDSSNRESLYRDVATVPHAEYRFRFPIMPVDYTFPAGHRVGIVLIANLNALQRNGTTGTTVTLNTKLSKVDLPIVGGYEAAVNAGAIEPVTATGTVGGAVPATLGLTVGSAAFPAFTPGVTREYAASTTANVISTAGDATLAVSDPGHLTNGAFSLAEPLRVELAKSSWTAPTSNESVGIAFKQLIKATDPLRTGTYTKTLTFTLSTTNP
ncbi:CocE/NonD family hydrolase [Solirubrobacter taibaiensis]|nr:CocE/NonD family hydrolase [Solirubrobacter taibaiensis]